MFWSWNYGIMLFVGGGGWNNRMTFFLRYPSVLQVLTPGMRAKFSLEK